MRRICTYIGLVCLGLLLTATTHIKAAVISDFVVPRNFSFERDLKLGTSTTPDVYYLQNILNMSTSTRIAETGAGSNKSLTTYYGEKTKDAVGRFQQIFAVDIAYEKSIATGTATSTVISSSTVDVFTRRILNKLITIYSDDRDLYIKSLTGKLPAESAAVEEAPEEAASEAASTQTKPASSQNSNSSNNSKPSISDKPEAFLYKNKKMMFQYSPQGQLLKAIGGNELVDKVFSYTPAGQFGKMTGQSGGGDGSGSGSGAAAGAAGALGIGAASGGGAAAASVAKPLNFGGVSTAMVTCTCSSNLLITVADVRGTTLPLIYQPGATVLYMYYQPRSGVNMLGQYVPGGQCLIYAVTGCVTTGSPVGTMIQLGTSLEIAPVK